MSIQNCSDKIVHFLLIPFFDFRPARQNSGRERRENGKRYTGQQDSCCFGFGEIEDVGSSPTVFLFGGVLIFAISALGVGDFENVGSSLTFFFVEGILISVVSAKSVLRIVLPYFSLSGVSSWLFGFPQSSIGFGKSREVVWSSPLVSPRRSEGRGIAWPTFVGESISAKTSPPSGLLASMVAFWAAFYAGTQKVGCEKNIRDHVAREIDGHFPQIHSRIACATRGNAPTEQERLEQERLEQERLEKEKIEKEKAEKKKAKLDKTRPIIRTPIKGTPW
ncbi:hypothetical protein ACJJTC_013524 [Scirpophaga incertulas]